MLCKFIILVQAGAIACRIEHVHQPISELKSEGKSLDKCTFLQQKSLVINFYDCLRGWGKKKRAISFLILHPIIFFF